MRVSLHPCCTVRSRAAPPRTNGFVAHRWPPSSHSVDLLIPRASWICTKRKGTSGWMQVLRHALSAPEVARATRWIVTVPTPAVTHRVLHVIVPIFLMHDAYAIAHSCILCIHLCGPSCSIHLAIHVSIASHIVAHIGPIPFVRAILLARSIIIVIGQGII